MERVSAVSIFSAVVRYASPMLIYFQGIMRFALHLTNLSAVTVFECFYLIRNNQCVDSDI